MVVIELACLMDAELAWCREVFSVMEGEWFCHKGGLCDGRGMVMLENG